MDRLAIRDTTVELPAFDADVKLTPVASLDEQEVTSDFLLDGASLRSLDLDHVRLLTGRIQELRTSRASFTEVRGDSVEFSGCDLSSLTWTASKLTRVRFTNCKLLGAHLSDLTLEHVTFANCKLDYAIMERVKATGPVVFSGCSLAEAQFDTCDLTNTLFDGCSMHLTEFAHGIYHRCDLRGNDLSSARGVANLRSVVIDRPQILQLAEALTADLDVTFGDE
ncbi:pentapeptide repeat-containing protein [Actinospica robiniae]|uniref:pentapeptide repeat-containing protein n=1 Tax=Actinospica robiniae TaxID=304901 RepID=UPI0003F7B4A7|nr:pentapeptide repeat-containing protein [Actinospica robiniae]